MKKQLFFLMISLPCLILSKEIDLSPWKALYAPQVPWRYVPFDEAMKRSLYPDEIERTQLITGIKGNDFLDVCKELYERYHPGVHELKKQKNKLKIHQVWLGTAPIPEIFQDFMYGWAVKHLNRGGEYRLWTDEDLKDFVLENQLYYDATDNIGVKADLLRYEILDREGGVYIDADFECLQPLDLFLGYDLFTALQPLDTGFAQLGIALIGCTPHHPIIRHCIETIKDDWHRKGATAKTGPIHFSKSFYLLAGKHTVDIAFPALYFYPQGCQECHLAYDAWIRQGSYAIHHWAKSWMPLQYRPYKFRFENQELCRNWDQ